MPAVPAVPTGPARPILLIVEDDPVSRVALRGLLRPLAEVDVIEAADGEEALALLLGGLRPLLCCSDIQMPGMDGLELVRRVREHPFLNGLAFILISSDSTRPTLEHAMRLGVAGFVVKPFSGQETRQTVQRVLREQTARRAEAPKATRVRLEQSDAGLARLLEALHARAWTLREAVEGESASAVETSGVLAQLHSGCVTLGLWRAASLLETLRATRATRSDVSEVLHEVMHAAREQLAAVTPARTVEQINREHDAWIE